MATEESFRLKGKGRDSYLELVQDFPLASIKSERHLAVAQEVMESLLVREKLDNGEAIYFYALSVLIAEYEDKHHAIEPASDADMLRHLMEAKGVSAIQLSQNTRLPKSSISDVLAGKRMFSCLMIRRLADYFGVDVSVLSANT